MVLACLELQIMMALFGTDVVNVTIFTSDQGGSGAIVSMSKGLLLSALTFASATDDTIVAAGEAQFKVSC